MQGSARRTFEMAARVVSFNRAHAYSDPAHVGVATKYEELVTRARTAGLQEQVSRLDARTANRRRKVLRQEVQRQRMRYLERVLDVASRDHPDLVGRFRGPASNASNAAFLLRGWDMLNLARSHQELLAGYGLAASQLDDLGTALTEYEEATDKANVGRLAHMGARKELLSIADELTRLTGLLDVLNRTRFSGNAERLGAWAGARNVVDPRRRKSAAPTPDTPPAAGDVSRPA